MPGNPYTAHTTHIPAYTGSYRFRCFLRLVGDTWGQQLQPSSIFFQQKNITLKVSNHGSQVATSSPAAHMEPHGARWQLPYLKRIHAWCAQGGVRGNPGWLGNLFLMKLCQFAPSSRCFLGGSSLLLPQFNGRRNQQDVRLILKAQACHDTLHSFPCLHKRTAQAESISTVGTSWPVQRKH